MLLLLAACVHTPPHDPVPGRWELHTERRERITPDGTWCSWEAENLSYDGRPVWTQEPPDLVEGHHNEDWCGTGGESARMMDVVAQDGPFLSTRVRTLACCPPEETVACVTWDLRTAAPARLPDFDEKRAASRWERLQRALAADPTLAGWTFAPDAFLVDGGHVRFCGVRGAEVREVRVK